MRDETATRCEAIRWWIARAGAEGMAVRQVLLVVACDYEQAKSALQYMLRDKRLVRIGPRGPLGVYVTPEHADAAPAMLKALALKAADRRKCNAAENSRRWRASKEAVAAKQDTTGEPRQIWRAPGEWKAERPRVPASIFALAAA